MILFNTIVFQETIWSNLPNLFFWICPIHGLVQTSISYQLTFTIWFGKMCMHIFLINYFKYILIIFTILSTLESMLIPFHIPYITLNQSEIYINIYLEIIYTESNYFSWALPLPTWSHHQLLYKHLSQLPHWSSGLQSYLQTSTTYFLYNSQYDSFKI